MRIIILLAVTSVTVGISATAQAFCGFYVARADTGLYNRASQVVLVRDENRTVITMANDFRGDTKDFAVVIPVPTVIERERQEREARTLANLTGWDLATIRGGGDCGIDAGDAR